MEKDSVNSRTLFDSENKWNKTIIQLQLYFSKACNISANWKDTVKAKLVKKKQQSWFTINRKDLAIKTKNKLMLDLKFFWLFYIRGMLHGKMEHCKNESETEETYFLGIPGKDRQ